MERAEEIYDEVMLSIEVGERVEAIYDVVVISIDTVERVEAIYDLVVILINVLERWFEVVILQFKAASYVQAWNIEKLIWI